MHVGGLMSELLYVSIWEVVWLCCLLYCCCCICCMTCCNASNLILNHLKVVEVSGGDDWGPCSAVIFNDGCGYRFLAVDGSFFVLDP